jgi:hypothetical protein
MHKFPSLLCAILLVGTVNVAASPVVPQASFHPFLLRIAAACFGGRTIPTEAHPILNAKLIAKMRRSGQLPDTFACGRCRYDIGGDPGAVYYVKTCR